MMNFIEMHNKVEQPHRKICISDSYETTWMTWCTGPPFLHGSQLARAEWQLPLLGEACILKSPSLPGTGALGSPHPLISHPLLQSFPQAPWFLCTVGFATS